MAPPTKVHPKNKRLIDRKLKDGILNIPYSVSLESNSNKSLSDRSKKHWRHRMFKIKMKTKTKIEVTIICPTSKRAIIYQNKIPTLKRMIKASSLTL